MNVDAPSIRWHRVIGTVLLVFAITEVTSRVVVRAWSGKSFQSLSLYKWSPYGLVRNNPRATSDAFQISANGFRNTKIFTQLRPKRTLRILMLGGSALYSGVGGVALPSAQKVDSEHTMAQYLERRLKADAELAGLNIEVINAAVNFNRIVEISCAYLTEYAFWEPDFIILCGSANNFGYAVNQGAVGRREVGIQLPHPWHLEFERLTNGAPFARSAEMLLRDCEEAFASVAIGKKVIAQAIDRSFNTVRSGAAVLGPKTAPPPDWRVWKSSMSISKNTLVM